MSEKAVFLDRDGTIIEDPGFLNHPDGVKLLPGAAEALVHLKRIGYKLVVVSNQSGVARGIVKEAVLPQITDRLKQLLGNERAYLDGIYYCPYHPDGVIEKYRKDTDCRKPAPGMLLRAAQEMDIDLDRSWMIGDSFSDIEAGRRAGCRTILLNSPPDLKRPGPTDPRPDFEAVNIKEAANIVKRQEYLSRTPPPVVAPAGETAHGSAPENRSPSSAEVEQLPDSEENLPSPEPAIAADTDPVETTEPVPARESAQTGKLAGALEQPAPRIGRIEPVEPQLAQKDSASSRTEQLLEEAVGYLRRMHQQDMFEEFSAFRLCAWIIEMLVAFCMLMAMWFWLDAGRGAESVLMALGFAAVLQLVALTLFLVPGRRDS